MKFHGVLRIVDVLEAALGPLGFDYLNKFSDIYKTRLE
jgi:hypothetical protein